ncbi:MAG: hypothetical protein ACTSRZ_15355, partial [Promethearchaeota archaeon]
MVLIAQITMLTGLFPELIAIIYSFAGWKKYRYSYFKWMFLTWAFLFFGNVLLSISYFTYDFNTYRLGVIINVPLCFTIIILMDSISSNHIDTKKMILATCISTALIITAWEEGSVKLNTTGLNEITPSLNGTFLIVGSLTFIFAGLNWLFYAIKITIHSPFQIKKIAKINLIGSIIAGPGAMLAFSLGIVWFFPGTDYLLIGIGALIFTSSFNKKPSLGFILPFTAYRIMIIHTESSLLI